MAQRFHAVTAQLELVWDVLHLVITTYAVPAQT